MGYQGEDVSVIKELLSGFSSADKVKDFTVLMRENNKTLGRRLCGEKSHTNCFEIYFIGAAAWPEDLATMEEVKASKSQVRIGIDVLAPITKNLADYLSR